MTINFVIIASLISLSIGFILYIGRVYFWKFLEKISPFPILREGCNYEDTDNINITHEGFIIQALILSVIGSFIFLFASEINMYFNIGASLVFLLPALFLWLRIETFSDKNILPETNMGYDPAQSYVLCLLGEMMGLPIGFSSLNYDNPISFPIIMISGALIVCLIPIFPDYINKFLDYDIRSERGLKLLRYITATGIFIQSLNYLYFSLFVLN